MKKMIYIMIIAFVATVSSYDLMAANPQKACCSCKCEKNCSTDNCKKNECQCQCRK